MLSFCGSNIPLLLLLLLCPQARALWLVGACGQELQNEQWVDAWGLAVSHMGAVDLVVALQAVQAVLLLAIQILDDQAIIDQVRGGVVGGGGGGGEGMLCARSGLPVVQAVLLLAIHILDDQTFIDQV
jgi:hypothetical protein